MRAARADESSVRICITAVEAVHEKAANVEQRHSIAGGPAGMAAHRGSPVALRRRLSTGLLLSAIGLAMATTPLPSAANRPKGKPRSAQTPLSALAV
jgi:hypothetical protein